MCYDQTLLAYMQCSCQQSNILYQKKITITTTTTIIRAFLQIPTFHFLYASPSFSLWFLAYVLYVHSAVVNNCHCPDHLLLCLSVCLVYRWRHRTLKQCHWILLYFSSMIVSEVSRNSISKVCLQEQLSENKINHTNLRLA